MSLESGKYKIYAKGDDALVGRRRAEDLSNLPKGVYRLPADEGDTTVWDVEELASGKYAMKANDAIVGSDAGLVFAYLMNGQVQGAEWELLPNGHDKDVFAVASVSLQGQGWNVKDQGEQLQQIAVTTLIVSPSFPPTYPPNELFVFKKVY